MPYWRKIISVSFFMSLNFQKLPSHFDDERSLMFIPSSSSSCAKCGEIANQIAHAAESARASGRACGAHPIVQLPQHTRDRRARAHLTLDPALEPFATVQHAESRDVHGGRVLRDEACALLEHAASRARAQSLSRMARSAPPPWRAPRGPRRAPARAPVRRTARSRP